MLQTHDTVHMNVEFVLLLYRIVHMGQKAFVCVHIIPKEFLFSCIVHILLNFHVR